MLRFVLYHYPRNNACIFRLSISTPKIPHNKFLSFSMLDFAPLYSGVIMGFSNTVANLTGILAPLTTGLLLDAGNSLEQWRVAFWISAAIYVSGWVAFQVQSGSKIFAPHFDISHRFRDIRQEAAFTIGSRILPDFRHGCVTRLGGPQTELEGQGLGIGRSGRFKQ